MVLQKPASQAPIDLQTVGEGGVGWRASPSLCGRAPQSSEVTCPRSHSKFGRATPGAQVSDRTWPGARVVCGGVTSLFGVCQGLTLKAGEADLP